MRAMDAREERPRIGRAIGGRPDLVAEGLCGEKGMLLLGELAAASNTTDANLGCVKGFCLILIVVLSMSSVCKQSGAPVAVEERQGHGRSHGRG